MAGKGSGVSLPQGSGESPLVSPGKRGGRGAFLRVKKVLDERDAEQGFTFCPFLKTAAAGRDGVRLRLGLGSWGLALSTDVFHEQSEFQASGSGLGKAGSQQRLHARFPQQDRRDLHSTARGWRLCPCRARRAREGSELPAAKSCFGFWCSTYDRVFFAISLCGDSYRGSSTSVTHLKGWIGWIWHSPSMAGPCESGTGLFPLPNCYY